MAENSHSPSAEKTLLSKKIYIQSPSIFSLAKKAIFYSFASFSAFLLPAFSD
jgi:hypothetical protein